VQECLENIELNISNRAKPFFNRFKKNMDEFETIRKKVSLCDSSTIKKNNNLAEELADVVIRVLSFAEFLKIDLLSVIEKKLKVNEKRPFLHGKKF
jgi:NTP pyrophosphatase (non-canonical NTP hydrolase)